MLATDLRKKCSVDFTPQLADNRSTRKENELCSRHQDCLRFFLVSIVLVGNFIFWFGFSSDSTLLAQDNSGSKTYLPFILGEGNEQAFQSDAVNPFADEPWPIYTSEKGGYSLSYPSGWTVAEGKKGSLVLTLPEGGKLDKITATYMDFEKPEEADLLAWAETFYALGLAPDLERSFSPVSLDVKDPDNRSQQVHSQYISSVPGEKYLITRGRLVLQIYTNSEAKEVVNQLRTVANSVAFAAEGPVNQEQLSSPAAPPVYTTIEAWQQELADAKLASDALRYRLETGEVADHLLAIMPERARQEYERILADAADYIAAIDRQREEQNSPGPFPTPDPGPNSAEYFEQERIYNEGLGKHIQEDASTQAGLETSITTSIHSAATTQDDTPNRRGVPTRITTPIRTYPVNDVRCLSPFHVLKDTYAIDIIVNQGTQVYGTTQNELVITTVTDPEAEEWGMYVWTRSQQYVRGINKYYYHVYAHLSQVNVAPNDVIQPTTIVGLSGNTGYSDEPHLHYQIHTHHDIDGDGGVYRPVDLSPMKGFVHNLNYPLTGDCGNIENPSNTPIIMEANEFQFSVQPVATGHYWNCSTSHPNHTGSCYRAAIPITPNWSLTPLNDSNDHLTPRISYQVWFPTNTNYRVWVCGMGGHIYDDSLHISPGGLFPGTADDMTGYQSTNWVWASLANDGSTPYLLLQQSYNDISMFIRENGMRVDRILLTKNFGYNPTNAGIRCGAQGL